MSGGNAKGLKAATAVLPFLDLYFSKVFTKALVFTKTLTSSEVIFLSMWRNNF